MKKKEIRIQYKQLRSSLPPEERRKKEEQITELFKLLALPHIEIVHRYLAVEEQNELSIEGIVRQLSLTCPSIRQAVPVMRQEEMISVHFEEGMALHKNKWGISEPVTSVPVPEQTIDCVLLPLLAFDSHGNRVGYGKGCYDRLLVRCRKDVIKIGFSFFDPVECIDDTDKFDIPLNYCITPDRIYEFG
jgi:5-formyltetrahydrofolate cyclo-ligase